VKTAIDGRSGHLMKRVDHQFDDQLSSALRTFPFFTLSLEKQFVD
jgi:hypothetical protein